MSSKKNLLSELTWYEVAERLKDQPLLLFPIGSVEQHGKQTPLGMDNHVAEHVAKGIAAEVDSIIVPTIPFGCAQTFSTYPGVISISPGTLQAYVQETVESLINQGFKYIVFIDNHGGNASVIKYLAWHFRQKHDLVTARIFPYGLAKEDGAALFPEGTKTWGHGSEPVLSLAHGIVPHAVRQDLAHVDTSHEPAWITSAGLKLSQMNRGNAGLNLDYADTAPAGIRGDPTQPDAERAKQYTQQMVDKAVAFAREFRRIDPVQPAAKPVMP